MATSPSHLRGDHTCQTSGKAFLHSSRQTDRETDEHTISLLSLYQVTVQVNVHVSFKEKVTSICGSQALSLEELALHTRMLQTQTPPNSSTFFSDLTYKFIYSVLTCTCTGVCTRICDIRTHTQARTRMHAHTHTHTHARTHTRTHTHTHTHPPTHTHTHTLGLMFPTYRLVVRGSPMSKEPLTRSLYSSTLNISAEVPEVSGASRGSLPDSFLA